MDLDPDQNWAKIMESQFNVFGSTKLVQSSRISQKNYISDFRLISRSCNFSKNRNTIGFVPTLLCANTWFSQEKVVKKVRVGTHCVGSPTALPSQTPPLPHLTRKSTKRRVPLVGWPCGFMTWPYIPPPPAIRRPAADNKAWWLHTPVNARMHCFNWLKFHFCELENSRLFAEFLIHIDGFIFIGL